MTLEEAIKHCEEQAEKHCDDDCGMEHKQLAEWLKELQELRLQSHWKPSDEQMKMLDKTIDVLNRMQLFGGRNALIDLKHDLKKLREE